MMLNKLYESFRRKTCWRFTACVEYGVTGQLVATTNLNDKFINLLVVFASFSRSAHSILWDNFFLGIEVWRISLLAPNLHLKARSWDNDSVVLLSEHNFLWWHELYDHMAYMTFKMTIFYQFRHALTRHDPKTYLAWLVGLTLLKLKE